jgi:hypothetical protein
MQEQMIKWCAERLPPLRTHKRPGVAVAIAVIFGGVGLALYLRSRQDTAVAAGAVVAVMIANSAGLAIGVLAILVALGQYAYARVEASNRRLTQAPAADAVPVPAV